jgi:3-deoxy-7-phosphoheptulonate synthase
LLPYEEALTRFDPETARWYSASAQMLWVGERTRLLDGAHLEFARGISNPIGLKCGPSLGPDELLRIIDTLNPSNELGRLTLIGRFGAGEVGEKLPCLMRAVQREGRNVIWSIDPMHGNTLKAGDRKTRHFDAIVSEVEVFVEIARAEGAHPGGLHLELTGDHVSECSGGPSWPGVPLMAEFHQARCDPRLNAAQAVELALRLAENAGIRPHRGALGSV